MINRRTFLTGSSVAAAGAVGFPHLALSQDGRPARPGQSPRHIIHMVADGMSMGTLTCADYFSQRRRDQGLTWMKLMAQGDVAHGWMNMRSLNSIVTDSSAAASSWGSGTRIINGMVNTLGDGTWLKPLYEVFREAGWRRGLVTTTEITHATPAGFATNATSRDDADLIAAQYLDRRVDLLLGGGRKYFKTTGRKDKRDLHGDFAKAGYVVMNHREDLLQAPLDKPWLGTFSDSHLPYSVDQRQSSALQKSVPTLAELTRRALQKLERESHFILQIEGGRVDHACHNCDAASALNDMVAFDEAIDEVLAFCQRHPDTLVLITTDHGNGNLGVNATGSGYGKSTWMFENTLGVRASFPEMLSLLKRKTSLRDADKPWFKGPLAAPDERQDPKQDMVAAPAEIVDILHAATGYKVPLRKAELYRPFLEGKGEVMYDLMKSDVAQLGQLLGNHLAIGWTSNGHTADYVPIAALGPGAEQFAGFIQNTHIFPAYLAFAGIDFRNPTEPLVACAGREAPDVEPPTAYHQA